MCKRCRTQGATCLAQARHGTAAVSRRLEGSPRVVFSKQKSVANTRRAQRARPSRGHMAQRHEHDTHDVHLGFGRRAWRWLLPRPQRLGSPLVAMLRVASGWRAWALRRFMCASPASWCAFLAPWRLLFASSLFHCTGQVRLRLRHLSRAPELSLLALLDDGPGGLARPAPRAADAQL